MEGEEFVLQRRSTSLAPRQWYELTVAVVEDAIKAYVDGQFAFVAYDDELVGGRVGLCAQGLYASRFDDLVVRSLRVDQGDFLEDRDGPAAELQPAEQSSPAQPPAKCGAWRKQDSPEGLLFESSSDFYGNVALEWEPHGPLVAGGSATLTICAEEADPDSGYSLTVLQEDNGSAGLCLARNGRTLRTVRAGLSKPEGESTAAPKSDPNNPFRFCLDKSGTLITASFNDEPIIEFSDPEPLAGPRLRFKTDLPLADAPQDLRVSSENERTELFAQAPVDWLMSAGDWEVYPPDRGFSSHPWLGNLEATVSRTSGRGASDRVGSAIVWHKGACAGDLALEYDVATPDATPQGPFPYNFNAALCADGRDLSSGYCVMFSPPGQTGEFEWPIRLIRKGKVVLETRRMLDEALSPSGDERERLTPVAGGWRLRIQKRGEFLRFFVNDRLAIEYRDRKPLNGSRWGLWTLGAPMAVSRVRIAWSQSADSLSVFASEEGHGATEPEGDMGTRSPRSLPSSHDAVAAFDPAESAVKVTNARCGGTFDFPLIAAPLKVSLSSQPTPDFLSFDFKCEPDVAINLYLKVGGRLYAIPLTGAHEHRRDVKVLPGIRLPGRSEAWQEVRLDLATLLARFLPGAQEAVIDDLWLGNASTNWRLAAGLSANRIDSAYWLRRITTSHQ
jgi:hypothetical protein